MSIFGDIGKFVGGAIGTAICPGLGTAIGSAVGGMVGDFVQKPAEDAINKALQDPMKALSDPSSVASNFVDASLKQLGVPAPFRGLVKFGTDPQSAILDALKHGFERTIPCVNHNGATAPLPPGQHGLNTNGSDTIDTGRYLISAKEGELKIYDKETNTWVKCHGDPHLETSDGDHGQFTKNLTMDLEDGTKVTIQPTAVQNGVAWIDKVAVTKGTEAVVMSGFHDGAAGVQMGNILNNADAVDRQFADGTVLRAGRQVDDLTYAADGKEIVGSDPSQRWGEHNLDDHGGISRNSSWFQPLPLPLPPITTLPGKLPPNWHPGLDLSKIKDILGNCPKDPSNGLVGGLKDLIAAATKLLGGMGAAGNVNPDDPNGVNPKGPGGPVVKNAPNAVDMENAEAKDADGSKAVDDDGVSLKGGGDVYSRLFAVLAKLQKVMEKKLGQIENQANKMDQAQSAAAGDESGKTQGSTMKDKVEMDKLQFELQQIQGMMQQITTTATNLLKTENDTRMSVVRNLA